MQLGLTYSLRKFIEGNVDIETIMHYDGIKLPEGGTFVLIKPRSNMYQPIAKARETVQTTYRFEVALFAESLAERSELQDELDDLFMFERMPLFTDEGVLTKRTVEIEVVNQVPLYPEDVSSETKMHRVYFNLEININRHKNRN